MNLLRMMRTLPLGVIVAPTKPFSMDADGYIPVKDEGTANSSTDAGGALLVTEVDPTGLTPWQDYIPIKVVTTDGVVPYGFGRPRTNSALDSSLTSTTYWAANNTFTANAIVSPDGLTNASEIRGTGIAAVCAQTLTTPSAAPITYSVYFKKGSASMETALPMGIYNNALADNVAFVTLNAVTGTLSSITGTYAAGATATVTDVGNGWFRVVLTCTTGINAGNSISVYAGNLGSALTTNDYWYAWGAQVEVGNVATKPIYTTTAAVTVEGGYIPVKKAAGAIGVP